jgi:hypothetical protein
LKRTGGIALVVGCVGSAACAAGIVSHPTQWLPACLVAYLFWLGLALGGLAVVMIQHLTGGGWRLASARVLESQAATLPLLAVLFVPFAYGMPHLYPWTNERLAAADEIIQRKSAYLNSEGFLVRAAVCFGIWIVWMLVLNRATFTSNAEIQQRRRGAVARFSGAGLVAWGLTTTVAAVDWAMSIEPHWYSSMYGVLFMAGQAVSALAMAIVLAVAARKRSPPSNLLTTSRLHDLGNLLLAFVMFWSYVSFMQYLIIWAGNLPEETPWYLRRGQGGWQYVVAALMGLHFLLPFLLLLRRQNKRSPWTLVRISVLLLAMRVVDLSWLILPAFTGSLNGESAAAALGWKGIWPLLVALPAFGGWWLAFVVWHLARRLPIPLYEFTPVEESSYAAQPSG